MAWPSPMPMMAGLSAQSERSCSPPTAERPGQPKPAGQAKAYMPWQRWSIPTLYPSRTRCFSVGWVCRWPLAMSGSKANSAGVFALTDATPDRHAFARCRCQVQSRVCPLRARFTADTQNSQRKLAPAAVPNLHPNLRRNSYLKSSMFAVSPIPIHVTLASVNATPPSVPETSGFVIA